MRLVIERSRNDSPTVHITLDPDDDLTVLADAVALARGAGDDAPVWVHGADDDRDARMRSLGLVTERTLLQLRRPLPAPIASLPTRPFTPDDLDELVAVNNRAFAWHPEQGGLTPSAVHARMAEPWFSADGLRVLELDGRIAGFCWTKVHDEPEPVGEIYVIGLDPDFAGRGLGGPLTAAGLEWLAARGLPTAMLYVEADNTPARRLYDRLGFGIHRTDRLWHRPVDR